MRRVSMLVFAASIWAMAGSVAEAQDTRPTYVAFGFGPTIGLGGGGVAFKLEESVGHHVLSPGNHPGLFVGGVLGQSFAGGATVLGFGARAGFDARVWSNRKVHLLVTPHMTLGASISLVDLGEGNGGRQTSGAFNLGFAGEARLVLANDRATVWVRPLGFDLHIRSGASSNYDILVGGSYNF